MSVDQEMIKFLAQPENLPLALEIADYVTLLKQGAVKIFWDTFNEKIQERFAQSRYGTDWVYLPYPNGESAKSVGSATFVPDKKIRSGHPYLYFVLTEENTGNRRLWWGVRWQQEPSGFTSPSLDQLKEALEARNKRRIYQTYYWVHWYYYKHSLFDCNFLMRIYQNNERENLIDEVASDYWKLFEDLKPLVETINAEVKQHA